MSENKREVCGSRNLCEHTTTVYRKICSGCTSSEISFLLRLESVRQQKKRKQFKKVSMHDIDVKKKNRKSQIPYL